MKSSRLTPQQMETPNPALNPDGHRRAFATVRAPNCALMNIRQLKEFCNNLSGAKETLYGEPSNILVYSVGDKTFAYFKTSDPERWRFSTRVTPDRFVELTDFPGVKPARYRGRFHWVTIVEVPRFPASYLTELVEWSYQRAFASLSKAKQIAIRTSHA
jgi:predicted DNA-binding protein (MmcQ/YjbR family)